MKCMPQGHFLALYLEAYASTNFHNNVWAIFVDLFGHLTLMSVWVRLFLGFKIYLGFF